jgi:uncharacterized protein (DUF1015 family)
VGEQGVLVHNNCFFDVNDLRICQTLETNAEMKALKKLKKSIEANGFDFDVPFEDAMHIFQDGGVNYLVNGHHRLAVAKELGIDKIEGVIIDADYLMRRYGVSPEDLKKISENANRTGNKLRWY